MRHTVIIKIVVMAAFLSGVMNAGLVFAAASDAGLAGGGKDKAGGGNDKYGFVETNKTALLPTSIAKESSLEGVIGKIISIGLSVLGIVFFGLTIYAGIIWMIARGDTQEVEKAKQILEGAIVGLVLVSASYAISRFVFDSLANNTSDPGDPSKVGCCKGGLTCKTMKQGDGCEATGGKFTIGQTCNDQTGACEVGK